MTEATSKELWQRVSHLDGKPIGLREAIEKYDISMSTVYRWIDKGYVRVLEEGGVGRGNKRLLNEADMAYAGKVADIRGRSQGRTIITEEYIPPHAKKPA
jgi:transposase